MVNTDGDSKAHTDDTQCPLSSSLSAKHTISLRVPNNLGSKFPYFFKVSCVMENSYFHYNGILQN